MKTKEQRIEKVEIKKIYVANDGREFENEEECRKYEQTARCVIDAMFNELKTQRTDYAGEDMQAICNDDIIYAVKIENMNQLEIVNKWLKDKDPSAYIIGEDQIGTIQLINHYWDGFYVIGTPDDLKKIYCNVIDGFFNELITPEKVKGEESC